MKLNESNKKIYVTKDYSIFKRLAGNRFIQGAKTEKIVQSIQEIGYITNPIIVNENLEVVDGQNRLEALKRLLMPVEYIIQEGISTRECIMMNVNQTNWKMVDYIRSYAEQGLQSYKYVWDLLQKYGADVQVAAVALTGNSRFDKMTLSSGKLNITDDQYKQAIKRLDYTSNFLNDNNTRSMKTIFKRAILHSYDFKDVDNERMLKQYNKYGYIMNEFSTILGCFNELERVYNYGNRGEYVSLVVDYKRFYKQQLEKSNVSSQKTNT